MLDFSKDEVIKISKEDFDLLNVLIEDIKNSKIRVIGNDGVVWEFIYYKNNKVNFRIKYTYIENDIEEKIENILKKYI